MIAMLSSVTGTTARHATTRAGTPLTWCTVGTTDTLSGSTPRASSAAALAIDLRVGHFFGLHGLQVLPFLAFLLTRPAAKRRLTQRQRVGLIWTAGLGYLGLTLLLTWQAMRAQPLIAPDSTTLLAAGLLAAGVAAGALLSLAAGRRTVAAQPA